MVDVLIVGGGQAGLAAARAMQKIGSSFSVYERHGRIGDSWRGRWDSLTLFSPRRFDCLPERPMSGDPDGYPTKDEMADYLESYARGFDLPVVTGEGVTRLTCDQGHFAARTSQGAVLEAAAVIVATGAFQRPRRPAFARRLAKHVGQFDAATYRCPAQLPRGRIAVVGGGGSGRQIALETADSHEVWLSTGRMQIIVPQCLAGTDIIRLFIRLGVLRADKRSIVGRLVRLREVIPGWHLTGRALKERGVRLVRRTVNATDDRLQFADGASAAFAAVIWAAGYEDDTSWLAVSGALDAHGNIVEERGVSPVPGLFYLGRSWQNSRSSALVCDIGTEAENLVKQVSAYVSARR
jgi:putative flavoprotein involved in K+ transport